MAAGLKARVETSLAKLGIPHEDVSDPDDTASSSAFFAEYIDDLGHWIQLVVTVTRGDADVWVQGGIAAASVTIIADDWASDVIAEYNASLQQAPNHLFSEQKLPRFRARGFQARVSWNSRQQKIVSTVVIPAREFSSATLGASLGLVAHICTAAAMELARSQLAENEKE